MSQEKFKGITDELKNRFKALLKEFNVVPATPAVTTPATSTTPEVKKFGELELEDGTIIKWEGEMPLAVGMPLMVIDPANPEGFLPAPDNTYKGKDGSVIVVTEGKVSEYTPGTPEVDPAATAAPGLEAQVATLRDELNAVKAKFSAVDKTETDKLNERISALVLENQNFKSALENSNKTVKEMFEIMEVALDTPQEDPLKVPEVKTALSKKDKLVQSLTK